MTQWDSLQLTQTPKAPRAVPGGPRTSLEGPRNVPGAPWQVTVGIREVPEGFQGGYVKSPWEVLRNNLGSLASRQVLLTRFLERFWL